MIEGIYPCTIICDRYEGTYSHGKFLAFYCYPDLIPNEIGSDDGNELSFWESDRPNKYTIGKGNSPSEAYDDLLALLNKKGSPHL